MSLQLKQWAFDWARGGGFAKNTQASEVKITRHMLDAPSIIGIGASLGNALITAYMYIKSLMVPAISF